MNFDRGSAFSYGEDETSGLSKRQFMAALALQALLSRTDTAINESTYGLIAEAAVKSVNALIEELSKSHD